jgi:hypothetical protein
MVIICCSTDTNLPKWSYLRQLAGVAPKRTCHNGYIWSSTGVNPPRSYPGLAGVAKDTKLQTWSYLEQHRHEPDKVVISAAAGWNSTDALCKWSRPSMFTSPSRDSTVQKLTKRSVGRKNTSHSHIQYNAFRREAPSAKSCGTCFYV